MFFKNRLLQMIHQRKSIEILCGVADVRQFLGTGPTSVGIRSGNRKIRLQQQNPQWGGRGNRMDDLTAPTAMRRAGSEKKWNVGSQRRRDFMQAGRTGLAAAQLIERVQGGRRIAAAAAQARAVGDSLLECD